MNPRRILLAVLLSSVSVWAFDTPAKYPVKLAEPLAFGDEFVEVTADGTLRRRYRVWGDYDAEMSAWKKLAEKAAPARTTPPRTFRLCAVFLKDATINCPDVQGSDGKPLRATFSTPPDFEKEMREKTAPAYADFTFAFTQGEVKCEWLFETLTGLAWNAPGKQPAWGCQAKAIEEQLLKALAHHKDSKIDMFVWCAGQPQTLNGTAKQKVHGPPYGISYTQWQLYGAYNLAACAPHLPLIVHEVNHRYLDNLGKIEGMQLTIFHGLNQMGYERGDLGYNDLLCTYRSVYLHIIRPAMWRRFSLTGSPPDKSEPFSGKFYKWDDVADDCWLKLPLLGRKELAQLTGLPSLEIVSEKRSTVQAFTLKDADRALLRSPYAADARNTDTALNNVLSLSTESCAVLATASGHWLIVRPEVADVFVHAAGKGVDLQVAGWLNESVRPLLVLHAPADLKVPEKEIGYFR